MRTVRVAARTGRRPGSTSAISVGTVAANQPGMSNDNLKDKIDNMADKAKDAAENVGQKIKDGAEKVADKTHDAAGKIKDVGKDLGKKVGG
jgi:gas vesicle protein